MAVRGIGPRPSQVEAKIFELQEAMAERGYSDAEIEAKVRTISFASPPRRVQCTRRDARVDQVEGCRSACAARQIAEVRENM